MIYLLKKNSILEIPPEYLSDDEIFELDCTGVDLSDSLDIDSDDEVFIAKIEKKTTLYEGSILELKDFNDSFMSTMELLNICETKRDVVLDLIRLTLPLINNLPQSYRRIRNSLERPELTETLLCVSCGNELSRGKINCKKANKKIIRKCQSKNCRANRLGLKENSIIKVYESNIFSQIEIIFREHLSTMEKYIGES